MAILSTGPIENNPVSGVRPTQQVTIRLVSRAEVDSVTVSIQGYVLSTTRTLYVSEVISIAPNEAVTRNYFADLDAIEFVWNRCGRRGGGRNFSVGQTSLWTIG